MNQRMILRVAALVLSINFAPSVFAAISQKDARNAIAKMAGMSFPRSSIHVDRIASSSDSVAEVSAALELPFRFAKEEDGRWRVSELRVSEGGWESIQLFSEAAGLTLTPERCDIQGRYQQVVGELTNRRARCLVADFFGVTLPSDEVRIKSVSVQSFGAGRSAVVVALVTTDFRLQKTSGSWQVVEFRRGSAGWVNLEKVPAAMNAAKSEHAKLEMSRIAAALDLYRQERGNFVVTDKHEILIDNLNPEFLHSVIRLDPWRNSYSYKGEPDHFTLRSFGPDGKENTSDDLVFTR
jgi:hypothetical protein